MKKKKKRKGKKLHWLYIVPVVIVSFIFLSQMKNEREMVRFYRYGNQYFEDGDYDAAGGDYQVALNAARKLFIHKECRIRCNKALAIVTPLTPDTVTEENLDDTIIKLENAVYLLTENRCAHMFDNDGHDAACQTLKNEIEAYIETLRPPEPEEEEDAPEEEAEASDTEETDDPDEQIRKELEQIQKAGIMERKDELDTSEMLTGKFEFYDGECW